MKPRSARRRCRLPRPPTASAARTRPSAGRERGHPHRDVVHRYSADRSRRSLRKKVQEVSRKEPDYVGEYGEYGYRGIMLWAEAVKKAEQRGAGRRDQSAGRNLLQGRGRALHDRRQDQPHDDGHPHRRRQHEGSFDLIKSFSQRPPSDTQAVCDLSQESERHQAVRAEALTVRPHAACSRRSSSASREAGFRASSFAGCGSPDSSAGRRRGATLAHRRRGSSADSEATVSLSSEPASWTWLRRRHISSSTP